MADAVGAGQAFLSICGSSLSVKAAMLAVAGGQGELLISRDAHKSVVAGLVFRQLLVPRGQRKPIDVLQHRRDHRVSTNPGKWSRPANGLASCSTAC